MSAMRPAVFTVAAALAALTTLSAAAAPSQPAGRAPTNYLLHCAGCHGADGAGRPEVGIPRMSGQVGHFARLPEGRAFLVQVPGTSQSGLSDADVAALLNWLLPAISRGEMPADFQPYTTDEVHRLRAEPLADAPGRRRDVVSRLRTLGHAMDPDTPQR